MRSRQQRPEQTGRTEWTGKPGESASEDSFEGEEWPDAQLGIEDDAFARAIAAGRAERIAA